MLKIRLFQTAEMTDLEIVISSSLNVLLLSCLDLSCLFHLRSIQQTSSVRNPECLISFAHWTKLNVRSREQPQELELAIVVENRDERKLYGYSPEVNWSTQYRDGKLQVKLRPMPC